MLHESCMLTGNSAKLNAAKFGVGNCKNPDSDLYVVSYFFIELIISKQSKSDFVLVVASKGLSL